MTIYNKRPQCGVHIRCMIRRDMTEVLDIDRESFEFPWLKDDFIKRLRNQFMIAMVADCGDNVAGYMIYALHSRRIHLQRIAVHPSYRRMRIGRKMIETLIGKLHQHRPRLMCEVPETNLPAQLFMRSVGLRCVSVLNRFYDTEEDAFLFQFRQPSLGMGMRKELP